MKYLKNLADHLKSFSHQGLKRFIVLSLFLIVVSAQPATAGLESLFWSSESAYSLAMADSAFVAQESGKRVEEIKAVVTAYSSTPDQTDDTPEIMASGKKVYPGAIACPRKYAFGTRVEINGKQYVCEDRMHIRFDDRFDIWYPTRQEAKNHGIKELVVLVYNG